MCDIVRFLSGSGSGERTGCIGYLSADRGRDRLDPVGYIHAKRMQQTLLKKNSGSIKIDQRSAKTGQVIGKDKNARNSNVETYSMVATDSINALRELMGPRSDNEIAKQEMYSAINRNGFVSLDELSNNQEDKIALNSLDVYFTMQGFRTNLVFPNDVIPSPKIS